MILIFHGPIAINQMIVKFKKALKNSKIKTRVRLRLVKAKAEILHMRAKSVRLKLRYLIE